MAVMLSETEIKERQVGMIKTVYRENFQRDITDDEISEIFKYLMPRMEDELKNIKGFSEAEFQRYMANKSNELLFSPMNIQNELARVLQNEGEEQLTRAGKYKRLREMEVATRYCFANFKRTGEMLMIKAQDNPDIVLALMGSKDRGKNVMASRMEVMTIPEIVKAGLGADLPTSIAKFVQDKKFLKDYGDDCSLIVCLDFTQEALNFNRIAEEIQGLKQNPYRSILLTFVSSEDGETMSVIQVYPTFMREDYNLVNEPNLLY